MEFPTRVHCICLTCIAVQRSGGESIFAVHACGGVAPILFSDSVNMQGYDLYNHIHVTLYKV